ncbi:head-tail adaptor protein [Neorhizobium sp. P12A]|uniref:head-tail adaptor protein n=1 Tax=Neorhizobium sp. P12A TaxID=2268027 RepID=UPI0011EEB0EE|nr:head-tail adaptor protein [Neorhizobium sp. P12A]KAA0689852.1 head-tail adaptor protein [Neorhizobium sp. P12A]
MVVTKPGAGRMREKLLFQVRSTEDDGYGNPQSGDWATVFASAAEIIPLKGGEPVLAARLTGVQPYIIRIRSSAAARGMTTAWRAIDARNQNQIFNIRSVANTDQKNAWLDIMAEDGVAT